MRAAVWRLLIIAAVSCGMAVPAHADLRNLWPFRDRVPQETEAVPDPFPYAPTISVSGADNRVQKRIADTSVLIEREDSPPSGLSGLISRARQDVARLTAVLYENGYYGGQVSVTIAGRPLETVGPFDRIGPRPVPVQITVDAGQVFRFGAVRAEPVPEGVLLDAHGFIEGEVARSDVVLRTEAALVEAWRERGHPLARALERDAVADHDTGALDVTLNLEPGPAAAFGSVSVVGAKDVDPELIRGRAGLGDRRYSVSVTRGAEKRLRDLGVFESVKITPADQLDADGTIPITITVAERKQRVIGGGVSYSDVNEFGGEVYWRHRNLFGGAEQLHVSGSLSGLLAGLSDPDYRLAGEFTKPGIITPMTDFTLRLEGYRDETEAYEVTAIGGEVGLRHMFSDTVSGRIGVELVDSETVDDNNVTEHHLLLSLPARLLWDTRDDRLYPIKGFTVEFLATPSHDFREEVSFARLGGDFSVYRSLDRDGRFVLAGRAAGAVLAVDDVTDVAADRRIYLGGAGSVRGYAYENIAPRDADGNLIGGRSSILFSGEVRYRLNERFGLVSFVDVGNVSSSQFPEFDDVRVGVGGGIRYLTPVGPIRFDVATPLQPEDDDPDIAFYVGLGQAF